MNSEDFKRFHACDDETLNGADRAMTKPSEALISLCQIGFLYGIHFKYEQTGAESAMTIVQITGSDGTLKTQFSNIERYLTYRPTHNAFATVKPEFRKQCDDWLAFEKKNADELAEYARLKKKFEGG